MGKNEADLAHQRFSEFVAAVGEEEGHRPGWKAALAERLEISPGHFSRVLSGRRPVSRHIIRKAAAEFGLDRRFFYSAAGAIDEYWKRPELRAPNRRLLALDGATPSAASERQILLWLAAKMRAQYEEAGEIDAAIAQFMAHLLKDLAVLKRAEQYERAPADEASARAMSMAVAVEALLEPDEGTLVAFGEDTLDQWSKGGS